MMRTSMITGYFLLIFIIVLLFIFLLDDKSTIYYGKVENNQGIVSNLVSDKGDIIEHLRVSDELQESMHVGDYISVKLSNKKNNIINEQLVDDSQLSSKILYRLNI